MGNYELGVIGAGNMAEAILRGALDAGVLDARDVVASDVSAARRELLRTRLGIACVEDNAAPAGCDRVLLAVKPQMMGDVLAGIADAVRCDSLLISIAAGIATRKIDEALARRCRILRVMPNTPMLVGEGIIALAAGPRATDDDLAWARRLFDAGGPSGRRDRRPDGRGDGGLGFRAGVLLLPRRGDHRGRRG